MLLWGYKEVTLGPSSMMSFPLPGFQAKVFCPSWEDPLLTPPPMFSLSSLLFSQGFFMP